MDTQAIQMNVKHDIMHLIIGIAVTVAFLSVVFGLMFVEIPEGNKEIYIHVAGIIEGATVTIVMFYFGSSRGSEKKTDALMEIKKQEG